MGLLPKLVTDSLQSRTRVRAALGAIALAVAVGVALPGAALAVPKVTLNPSGGFGLPTGTAGGQLVSLQAKSVAVNTTGAGGVPAGSVYVADGNANNRVQQFTASGQFVRTWGYDVITSGKPNDSGTGFEVCDVTNGNVASDCKAAAAGLGAAAGQLANPGGIAIDQSNGYVYVTSNTNRRVDVFSATGQFAGAFGWGVRTGAAALEICTTATGCRTSAAAGAQAGNFSSIANPGAVAIDPSVPGRFYVGDSGNLRVAQYDTTIAAGVLTVATFDRAFGWGVRTSAAALESCTTASTCQAGTSGNGAGQFTSGGSPTAVAVDSHGSIYVASGPLTSGTCSTATPCRVQKFAGDLSTVTDLGPTSGIGQLTRTSLAANTVAPLNVAVDPSNDHVFVLRKGVADRSSAATAPTASGTAYQVVEFDSAGNYVETDPSGTALPATTVTTGSSLAVGVGTRLYTGYSSANTGVFILDAVPAPDATISSVTNVGSSTATFRGIVTPPGFDTTYHFEYSTNGIVWTQWPTADIDVGSTNAPVAVSQDVTGLQPSALYLVRLVATTGTPTTSDSVTFRTSAAVPSISDAVPESVDKTSAKLTARVNPNNQATSYHFEWGTDGSYGNQVPADFEPSVGSGGDPVKVTGNVAGLQPGTTYHYRVVATNASGTATGPDRVVQTLNQCGLIDNRCFELVSPVDKGGPGQAYDYNPIQVLFRAGTSGDRVFYPLAYGLPDATASGTDRYVATRTDSGWQSTQATPPNLVVAQPGVPSRTAGRFQYVSPDATCGILASPQPLTADAPTAPVDANGGNLFRRDADGSYTLITNLVPTNATSNDFKNDSNLGYHVVGASEDCGTVVFTTQLRYPGLDSSGLYEWRDGTLQNVAIRPDGTPAPSAKIGSGDALNGGYFRALSADGSRLYVSGTSNDGNDAGKTALYVRQGSTTTKVSGSTTSTVDLGPYYQTASKDGNTVLFLANYGLTPTSSAGPAATNCAADPPHACDLYAYDLAAGTLTDLSADTNGTDTNGATVAGVVAASDDASRVYFVARGQLVANKGSSYAQNVANQTDNLYLSDHGVLSFVAMVAESDLSRNDASAVNAVASTGLLVRGSSNSAGTVWWSHATPDGRHLLFSTTAANPGAGSSGAAQAYVYSDADDSASCISCRRDGAPSLNTTLVPTHTVPDQSEALVQETILSDDGSRAFFTSADPLTAGAVSGNGNVYEWQDGQVTLLATGPKYVTNKGDITGLYGSTPSGDDVFIGTSAALDPADTDGVQDIYDLRVNGGLPAPPAPEVPCDPLAGQCQGSGLAPVAPELGTLFPSGPNAPAVVRGTLTVKSLTSAQRTALVAGKSTTVSVTVNRSGSVSVKGTALIGGPKARTQTVLSASRTASGAGTVSVPVRLSKAARTRIGTAGKLKVTMTVRFSSAPENSVQSVTFTKAKKKKAKKRSVSHASSKQTRRATVPALATGKVR